MPVYFWQLIILTGDLSSNEPKETLELEAELASIESQIKIATRSGGISPESYAEMENKIKQLEDNGYDSAKTQELRDMLSKLKVGGKTTEVYKETQNNTSIQNSGMETRKTNTNSQIVTWHYRDGRWAPNGNSPKYTTSL